MFEAGRHEFFREPDGGGAPRAREQRAGRMQALQGRTRTEKADGKGRRPEKRRKAQAAKLKGQAIKIRPALERGCQHDRSFRVNHSR